MSARPRYEPCLFLQQEGIPCVVWFEDAIGHYGVPTVVFDLYLLVSDIDAAAEVLLNRGWTYAKEQSVNYHFLRRYPDIRRCRLDPPGIDDTPKTRPWPPLPPSKDPPRPTTTVLLPASDWKLPSEKLLLSLTRGFIPSLPDLTDGLIESLLDSPGYRGLEDHLSVHIAYLYGRVPTLKERSFASELKYENRQFHHDVISGFETGTQRFLDHERQVREELRNGKRQLQECSVARTPENEPFFFGYLPPGLRKSS
jgi:hypothetical protein